MPKLYLDTLENEIKSDVLKMISDADEKYDNRINELRDAICNDDNIKVVLLTGPSGSGKTTSANILKDKLIAAGKNATVISLDNFYRNIEDYPKDENGIPDWESINALDTELITDALDTIIKTGSANIPRFDFAKQHRSDVIDTVDVGHNGVMIIEGIHALNPIISQGLCQDNIFRVFVSVSTGIKGRDEIQLISGKQIRLLRRLIRDRLYRGYSVKGTLNVWQKVLDGESMFLYPYRHLANMRINTFHSYEAFIYADFLKSESFKDELCAAKKSKFYNVIETCCTFRGIPLKFLPETSLITEFVPGGIYKNIY